MFFSFLRFIFLSFFNLFMLMIFLISLPLHFFFFFLHVYHSCSFIASSCLIFGLIMLHSSLFASSLPIPPLSYSYISLTSLYLNIFLSFPVPHFPPFIYIVFLLFPLFQPYPIFLHFQPFLPLLIGPPSFLSVPFHLSFCLSLFCYFFPGLSSPHVPHSYHP